MVNAGLIGLGYWGSKLKEELETTPDVTLYTATRDYKDLLKNKDIEVVYIATPVNTHFDIVNACFKANKNVVCEKNFTEKYSEARYLVEQSKKLNLNLAVDYIYTFTTADMKQNLDEALSNYNHKIDIIIKQHGVFREENVLSILGSHAFSMLEYILPSDYTRIFKKIRLYKSKNSKGYPTRATVELKVNTIKYNDIDIFIEVSLDEESEEKTRQIIFKGPKENGIVINFAESNGIERMVTKTITGYDNTNMILNVSEMVHDTILLGN